MYNYALRIEKTKKGNKQMKVVVGLGNIGKAYGNTHHNVGFLAVDALAKALQVTSWKHKFRAMVAECMVSGEKVLLVKPETYMNLSGESVREVVQMYHINPATDLCVILDDVDLPAGSLRIREKGSAGTHNGLRNIVQELKTTTFLRIRIAVGGKPEYMTLADYVLAPIKNEAIWPAITKAAQAAQHWLEGASVSSIGQSYNMVVKTNE